MGFPDSPVKLPDGKLVCEDHGLQICYQCCCDYTLLNDDLQQSQSMEEPSVSSEDYPDEVIRMVEPAAKVLQGAAARCVADAQTSKYCEDCRLTWMTAIPGSAAQNEAWNEECPHHDSLGGNRAEQRTLAVHVDGACPGNGTPSAIAGVGIYFGPSSLYNLSAPLTSNIAKPPTSQKAELLAAIRALDIIHNGCMPARRLLIREVLLCICHTECWARGFPFQAVIVTDSSYFFECMTSHLLIWRWDSKARTYSNKRSGNIIKNSEYIRNIVEEVEKLAERGVQVLWKKVSRAMNQQADRLAKAGAVMSRFASEKE
jgi:ribonuclease HI